MTAILTARKFRISIADPEIRAQLIPGRQDPELPGVFVDRNYGINVPDNAIAIIRARLDAAGIEYGERGTGEFPTLPYEQIINSAELNDLALESIDRLEYQREALIFACNRRDAMLAHATGSGKSLTALAWGLAAKGPILYCTKAAARLTVRDEIMKWLRNPDYELIEGLTPAPLRPARIYIVGAETLAAWEEALVQTGFKSLVLDESHKFQNDTRADPVYLTEEQANAIELGHVELAPGERFVRFPPPEDAPWEPGQGVLYKPHKSMAAAAGRLAKLAQRRLICSATPIPDRVRNLWAQLDSMEPWAWGSSKAFKLRYCAAKPGAFGGLDASGKSNQDELEQRLRVVQHVVTKARANVGLPALRRSVLRLRPDDLDRPAGGFVEALRRTHNIHERRELELMRLASMKRSYVIRSLVTPAVEGKQKVLVFTGRRQDADWLGAEIKKKLGKQLGKNLWCGHGDHSDKARHQMRTDYMAADGPAVLVGTIDAWGEAYNLQSTDVLILPMLPYTPAKIIQAEGRVQRRGMTRPAIVYYVVAQGTIDERISLRLLDKLPAIERLAGDPEAGSILRALQGTEEEITADLLSMIDESIAAEAALDQIEKQ